MRLDHLFFLYMAAVGAATGATLVAAPQAASFAIKPYFWVLIAVAVFDAIAFLRGRGAPGTMLGAGARVTGFIGGALVMLAVVKMSGVSIDFF